MSSWRLSERQDVAVVYVHGMGNKPTASDMRLSWDTALGIEGGRMAYWVDRDRYPTPEPTFDQPAMRAKPSGAERSILRAMRVVHGLTRDSWLDGVGGGAVARRVIRKWLPDVEDLLGARRAQMVGRFVGAMPPIGTPTVVVAHSLGTAIAYVALSKLQAWPVPLFLTVGSPLGMRVLERALGPYRKPACVARWLNVAERLDLVAVDGDLGDDVAGVENICEVGVNLLAPAHPHVAEGYLASPACRGAVTAALRSVARGGGE